MMSLKSNILLDKADDADEQQLYNILRGPFKITPSRRPSPGFMADPASQNDELDHYHHQYHLKP